MIRVRTLTARQADVLRLAAAGYNQDEIAERLGVTRDAVNQRMILVRIKLSADSTDEAVAIGWRTGILSTGQVARELVRAA